MKYLWLISKDGQKGRVVYDSETKEVDVSFPHPVIALEVQEYLNTDQTMWYPIGEGLDQDEPRLEPPKRHVTNMQAAMSGLLGATGVFPKWKGPA